MLHRPFLKDIKNKSARINVRNARAEAALCKITQLNPKLNAPLLIMIRERIKADPELFNMAYWFSDIVISGSNYLYFEYGEATKKTCGTAACIAGWAVSIDAHINDTPLMELVPTNVTLAERHAGVLLGLDPEQRVSLFYHSTWQTKVPIGDRNTLQAAIDYINQILNGEIEIFNKAAP